MIPPPFDRNSRTCRSSQTGRKRTLPGLLVAAATLLHQQQNQPCVSTCHAIVITEHPRRLLRRNQFSITRFSSARGLDEDRQQVDNRYEEERWKGPSPWPSMPMHHHPEQDPHATVTSERIVSNQNDKSDIDIPANERVLAPNNGNVGNVTQDPEEKEEHTVDDHPDEVDEESAAHLLDTDLHEGHGHDGNEKFVPVENSYTFQIVFSVMLGLIFLFRAVMCGLLIKYRKDSSLQLAQPFVLAALITAGSISIISCIFLIHTDRSELHNIDGVFCVLRDFFIMTPLTFAGSILLARVWRVVLLLTPVFTAGKSVSHQESEGGLSCGAKCKGSLILYLTNIADFYYWIEWTFDRAGRRTHKTMRKTSTALRKKVPLQQLFLLTFMLTLPQLILQILIMTVPQMQKAIVAQEDITFGGYVYEQHVCGAETGSWPVYIGILLMFVPYVMTAIIAWNSADELPKVFNEAQTYTKCSGVILLTVAVALPPLIFDQGDSPDTTVYLVTMLVFSLAMPPCWFLIYPRIWQAMTTNDEQCQNATQSTLRRLLKKKKSASQFLPMQNRDDNGKSAKLALTIGKMYEDMGMAQKSIDLFDEALAVWECDPGREHKEKIGGFTHDEINSFTVQDLEHIVNLMIAKGRVNGTFQVSQNDGQKNAAQSWLDALEIYEMAPARAAMKDRSMLFPVFSGLFVFLKGGKISQDAKCHFEQNLSRKFVRETKLQGDPIHYTRALAMFCEVKARLGKYRIALESFQTLKEIYDPEEHSEGVATAYGTDRSAQAFSQSALWHLQLGEEKKALDACEYVLDDLMPLMDPKNVLNSCEMLLPIMYVYKTRGQENRMKNLFLKYVVNNHDRYFKDNSSPCAPVFKPMIMLLSMCHDPLGFPNFDDAVEWLVVEENGVASEFLDSIYTKLCWSMHSLVAELCLRVAKRLIDQSGAISDARVLVLKGLRLSKKADKKMKNNAGFVTLPIAYALHEPVYAELKDIAVEMGISSSDDFDSLHSSFQQSSVSDSLPDPKNLPPSYLKKSGSSQDSASSEPRSAELVMPTASTIAQFESGTASNSSCASVDRVSRNSRLESHAEEEEPQDSIEEQDFEEIYIRSSIENIKRKESASLTASTDSPKHLDLHRRMEQHVTFSSCEIEMSDVHPANTTRKD